MVKLLSGIRLQAVKTVRQYVLLTVKVLGFSCLLYFFFSSSPFSYFGALGWDFLNIFLFFCDRGVKGA